MNNKIKIILVATIAILLTLISFVGIYKENNGIYKNIMNGYSFSKNLKGSRVIEISVNDGMKQVAKNEETSENEEIDEDAEIVENTEATEKSEESNTVEEKINPDSVLTKENYELSKNIIDKRLKTLGVSDYIVKLNKDNGRMVIEVPEDSKTDDIPGYLGETGSFEIVDKDTKEVLLNNDDLKEVQVAYNTANTGTTVYIVISFDNEGTKKLEDITGKYIATANDDGETITKEVTLRMEDEDLFSTHFNEIIKTGTLQLTLGSETADASQVQEYLENGAVISMLLNSGKMPISYKVISQRFVKPVITSEVLTIIVYVVIAILTLSFIYIIFKYKKFGAAATLSSVIWVDLLLLAVRYTNVNISIETFVTFLVLILFNVCLIKNILKNINNSQSKEEMAKEIRKGLIDSIDIIVILLIISVVFAFVTFASIANIGLAMFWGLVFIVAAHVAITRTLLLGAAKE